MCTCTIIMTIFSCNMYIPIPIKRIYNIANFYRVLNNVANLKNTFFKPSLDKQLTCAI